MQPTGMMQPVLALLLLPIFLVSCQQKTCNKELGMASGEIPDSGILVSSESPNHEKGKMRFGSFENVSQSAWCPNTNNDSWVEIHLPKVKSVSKIIFQLPAMGNPPTIPTAFMTRFNMEFLPYFGDEKYILFNENIKSAFNATLSYSIIFDPAIVTNTIKLTPTEWQDSPCFRMEIIGCDITDLCPDPYCLNDGVCAGSDLCYCPQPTLVGEKCQYGKPCVPVTMYNFTDVVNETVTGTPSDFKVIKGEALLEGGCSPLLQLHNGGCVQMPLDELCLKDLDNCFSGFTISLSIKQDTIVDSKYFLTTGGELGSHSGITFYYQNHKLIVSVTMSKRSWRLVKQFSLLPNKWYWFEISWTPNFGLSLQVNGLPEGYQFQYSTADPTGTKSESLVVGCSTQVKSDPNTLWVKNLVFAPLRHEDLNGTIYYNYAGGLTNSTPCFPPPSVMECMEPPTTTQRSTTTEVITTAEAETTTQEAETTTEVETTTDIETTTQEAETTTEVEITTEEVETTSKEVELTTEEVETTTEDVETTTEAETTTKEVELTTEEVETTTEEAETTTEEVETTTEEVETTTGEVETTEEVELTTEEVETTTGEVETTTEEVELTTEAETITEYVETTTEELQTLTEATTMLEELTTEEPTTSIEEISTTKEITTEKLSTEPPTTTETTTTTTTTLPTTEIKCKTPLWQTGIIKDVHVVSSSNGPGKTPIMAKSDCCAGPTVGGWCPDPKLPPTAQYLEVTFEKPYGVKEIEILPPEGTDPIYPSAAREYMTNYTFQYVPFGGINLTTYGTQSGPIYMLGVRGNAVTVVSTITEIIGLITERVRISVADFKNEPCFRFELFGCEPQYLCKPMCENGGTCIYENTCACPPPFYGPGCKYTHLPPASGCLQPLGMWNGTIKDSQLVASSSSFNNGKEKARYLCCFGETKGAWCPDKDDRAPYYEVHLNKPYLVAMIMFEHPNTLNYWEVPDSFLNTFTLQYRNVYQDAMETYAVNIDAIYNSSISLSPVFDPFILTDVIRIVPSKWTKEPCFRFEIIGCDPDQGPVDNPLTTTKSPFFNPGVIIGRRRRGIYSNHPANILP